MATTAAPTAAVATWAPSAATATAAHSLATATTAYPATTKAAATTTKQTLASRWQRCNARLLLYRHSMLPAMQAL
eukprot:477427-Pleurochrysis_carterae.AAC.1